MSEHCVSQTYSAKEANDPSVLKRRASALRSPSVYWMNLAGWLLLASFWMPVSTGCDGKEQRVSDSLERPMDTWSEKLICSTVVVTTYGDGVLWALALPIVALTASRRLFSALFKLQLAAILWLLAFVLYTDYGNQELVEGLLEILPILCFIVLSVIRPMIQGDDIFAWSRLQLLSILAVILWLHLACAFCRSFLWGYFVTLLACALMFVAVMIVRHRVEYDLWDSRIPVRRPQFSLKQTFIWSTTIALLLFYYKYVSDLARAITG